MEVTWVNNFGEARDQGRWAHAWFYQRNFWCLSNYMESKLPWWWCGDWWDWTAGDQAVTVVGIKGKIFRIKRNFGQPHPGAIEKLAPHEQAERIWCVSCGNYQWQVLILVLVLKERGPRKPLRNLLIGNGDLKVPILTGIIPEKVALVVPWLL